jgi:predicted dehydrogenase
MNARIGVGIVGVHPSRGWAATAHLPALRASPDYSVVAVSNPSIDIAREAAIRFEASHAFDNLNDLVSCAAVDLVVITVKVPRHFELVSGAIRAGKSVLCEWPLGNGLLEAIELQRLASDRAVRTFVGLQSRASAELRFARDLIRNDYVGEVLSASLVGSGIIGGAEIPEAFKYTLDPANGAGILNVAFGHAIDSVCYALDGSFEDIVARLHQRRKTARLSESGETIPMRTPDQIIFAGALRSGPVVSAHFRGGLSRATNYQLEINGTRGDLILSGSLGYPGVGNTTLRGGEGADSTLHDMAVPVSYLGDPTLAGPAQNVLHQYTSIAADLNNGTTEAPSFADAVNLHRLIHSIEQASATGVRQHLDINTHGK